MPAEQPVALTLDLFGTLVDFSLVRDERPLVGDLLAEGDHEADPDAVLDTWVQASLAERARTPFRTVRASLVQGAGALARRHDLAIDPSYWASALESLWATRPLREDVAAALEQVRSAGVPWAIVSNVDEPVLSALARRTGLRRAADAVVSSHQARAYKPHPRPFRMALDRLGVEPGRAVHVGDSAGEDRAGAKAAGMRGTILVEGSLPEAIAAALDP
jgi:2-haloalkanoic acid dehalogenase type II